jgi:hypothetical protein
MESKLSLIELYKNDTDDACSNTTNALKKYEYTKNEVSTFANMYGNDLPEIVHLMLLGELYDLHLCGLSEITWTLMKEKYDWFYRQQQYEQRFNKGIGLVN